LHTLKVEANQTGM